MRTLPANICLTLTILLGSMGVSASADFQKSLTAAQNGDFATALRQWTPLAKKGDAVAQFNLGLMYRNGNGVPQDYKTTAKWYKLAAKQEDADAQSSLNKIKSRLISKGIDDCLFDEIDKVTGPKTKKIVEKYCRNKLEKKSLRWLLRKYD